MTDREKVIKGIECCLGGNDCDVEPRKDCPYNGMCLCANALEFDLMELLKEQESLFGFRQTADGITFISTGTAQEGEKRGIILGKKLMHEWLYKELLYKDLLTDEIRSVFEQAESI